MEDRKGLPPPYDPNPPPPTQQYVAYPTNQPIQVTVAPPQPNTVIVTSPTIIAVGRCPACRVGVLTDHFTCLGIFCAVFFFPLGILCCFLLTEKRCSNCRLHFS